MLEKIKSYLLYNANQNNEDSISKKLRDKRFNFFRKYCDKLSKPVRILDLGGSDYHWRNTELMNNKDFHITAINTENQSLEGFRNFCFINRDVLDPDILADKEYDIIYSNSLFEHISKLDDRKKLAADIIETGKNYFIQTPNYYFPVEPHFLFPFFQFLSEETKTRLLMKYDLGWFKKQTDKDKARELAASVKLLKKSELEEMFPGGRIFKEKYFMLSKSFIIYK